MKKETATDTEKLNKFIDDIRLAGRIFIAVVAFSLATAMAYTIVEDVRETKKITERNRLSSYDCVDYNAMATFIIHSDLPREFYARYVYIDAFNRIYTPNAWGPYFDGGAIYSSSNLVYWPSTASAYI